MYLLTLASQAVYGFKSVGLTDRNESDVTRAGTV